MILIDFSCKDRNTWKECFQKLWLAVLSLKDLLKSPLTEIIVSAPVWKHFFRYFISLQEYEETETGNLHCVAKLKYYDTEVYSLNSQDHFLMISGEKGIGLIILKDFDGTS